MDVTTRSQQPKSVTAIGWGSFARQSHIPRTWTLLELESRESPCLKWLKISRLIQSWLSFSYPKDKRKYSSCLPWTTWEIRCTEELWIPYSKVGPQLWSLLSSFDERNKLKIGFVYSLSDSPLDLSTSLLSRAMVPSPGSTSSSPPSFGGDADERKSPVTSSETSSNAGDLLESLRHSTHSQVLNEALNLRHSGSEVFNEYPIDGWKSRQGFHSQIPVFRNSDIMLRRQQKMRNQRGERNLLPCEVCGKAFDRPSLLKRHMRTHTGTWTSHNLSLLDTITKVK